MLQQNAVEPATLELLKGIYSSVPFENFALGGGTNLALRLGHRLSVDHYFFTNTPYQNSIIFQAVTTRFPSAELLFEQNQTMMFTINNIKVDFILYPFKWLLPFETIDSAMLIALTDFIPMKLQALSNRFSKKDFWDIAFLLKKFSLSEMLEIFKSKFPQIDTGYIIHSLTNFEEAEREQQPVALLPKTWTEIKSELQKVVIDFTASSI
ncbi:MAG TPA: nucleotidyl transferase AbiEii/AbiGii toxin family protein [Hanamia sp.]